MCGGNEIVRWSLEVIERGKQVLASLNLKKIIATRQQGRKATTTIGAAEQWELLWHSGQQQPVFLGECLECIIDGFNFY